MSIDLYIYTYIYIYIYIYVYISIEPYATTKPHKTIRNPQKPF